jgi:hypothetical protein
MVHHVSLTENERNALLNLLEREQTENGLSAAQSNALKALRASARSVTLSNPVTGNATISLYPGGAA